MQEERSLTLMGKMITVTHRGDFKKTVRFLNYVSNDKFIINKLNHYGQRGVDILKSVTPRDTGLTAEMWNYQVVHEPNVTSKIIWTNDNMAGGVPVVILLQYGHGTRGGAYVKGTDFINPAMKPLFDQLADEIWREVTNA